MASPIVVAQRIHVDWPLLAGLLLMSALGLIVLYSAGGQDLQLVMRQSMRFLVAIGTMLVLAQVPPRHLFFWTPWLYFIGVALLVLVLVVGEVSNGAQRWLRLGPVSFQPSELMKITVPLMVAYYLSDHAVPPRLWQVVVAAGLALAPAVLVAKQPDLGTALLIGVSGCIVLFLAGMGWRLIGLLTLGLSACVPVLWYLMHDYQRRRVLTFLDPEQDPLGSGYHIIQSKIAIGSGGLYGKGWLNGTQSQLDFLPERSTDFIFAVYSEEFGMLGALLLLTAYMFLVFRGLGIAIHAQDTFNRLVAGALSLTFFGYVFVNMGMVSGLLPVVGVPLPLLSYGGTALVTLFAGFGILISIHTHRRLLCD
jgi:rod shape determining protein RodA